MESKENRRFNRLRVAISCSVAWKGEIYRAQVTNLSHGGALITDADFVPEEAAQVVWMFQSGEEEISL